MHFLIDGYNVLFTLGFASPRDGPKALRDARYRLLAWLAAGHNAPDHGHAAGKVVVVFDAARAPRGTSEFEIHSGIHVYYAIQRDEADDLIEELIQQTSAPKHLHVVSNDHRLQTAARRRRCVVMKCAEYLEWLQRRLERRPPAGKAADLTGKPARLTDEETAHWLREFDELRDSPELKELSDPDEFYR